MKFILRWQFTIFIVAYSQQTRCKEIVFMLIIIELKFVKNICSMTFRHYRTNTSDMHIIPVEVAIKSFAFFFHCTMNRVEYTCYIRII